jgi:hypothetical protein
MSKLVGRKSIELNIKDLKTGHIPIYDQSRGLWQTVSTASLASGISGSILEVSEITASVGFSGPLLGTASAALVALEVLQTNFTGSFTGSFAGIHSGNGSELIFETIHTSQSYDSTLVIGNVYNNYENKQTTIFKNGDIVISGSVRISTDGLLILTPREAPTPAISGGFFYSSSGDFFVGTA